MVNRNNTTNYKLRTIYPDKGRANRKSFGFTLIELLVVISIIGILLSVATVSFLNAQQKGRDNKRKTDLKAVQQALEIYYNQNGKYPDSTTGRIRCNTGTAPNNDTATITWSNPFTCDPDTSSNPPNPVTYMNPTPKDPTNVPPYYYDAASPYSSYKIYAKLENANDKDMNTTPASCDTSAPLGYIVTGTKNYCVVNP